MKKFIKSKTCSTCVYKLEIHIKNVKNESQEQDEPCDDRIVVEAN